MSEFNVNDLCVVVWLVNNGKCKWFLAYIKDGTSEWRGICCRSSQAPGEGEKQLSMKVSCYWQYDENYSSWATVRCESRWLGLNSKWKVNQISVKECKGGSKTL